MVKLVLEAIFWLAVVAYTLRPVSRERLERFARRQSLVITVDNGPMVLDYLASTRRWRVAGLLVGAAISFGFSYTQRSSSGDGAANLLGWFAGALVAEWRMQTRQPQSRRRVASLIARRFVDYLPKPLLVLDGIVWVAALGLGGCALAFSALSTLSVLVGLGFAVLVVPATFLVARRILTRAQALTTPDVLAADDALRSRSLLVLAGSVLALNGILCALFVSRTIDMPGRHNWLAPDVADGVGMIGAFLLPFIGLIAAMSSFATRRRTAVPSSQVAA